jgi:hypothetical protein
LYIKDTRNKLSFVSTNSICQGLQVSLLWPYIFKNKIKISFAHTSFRWQNNAKSNAAVTVIILGLSNITASNGAYIIKENYSKKVEEINGYLISGNSNTFIFSRTNQLSGLPKINHGNMPADGGCFLFTADEKNNFIMKEPESDQWFKKILSAREHLNGRERWCLWLEGINESQIASMPLIKGVIDSVKAIRLVSSRPKLASIPHLFAQITQPKNVNCVIIPRVSSERRDYLPASFIDGSNYKVTDSLFTIATNEPFLLGLITSRLHTLWLRSIGGKMKTDFQYSKNVVYNTFPFPRISKQRKEELTQCTLNILDERSRHSEKTLAELYDPDKMPAGLKEAHRLNDLAVERCYRSILFNSDEERLEYLFKLYEKMIQEEKEKNTLFAKEKKIRKKKIKK